MAIKKENLIAKNRDLKDRMSRESWKITFDKKSDNLIVGTKFPKESVSMYLDEDEGVLVRVDNDGKIYGFIIENYKSVFLKSSDMSLIFWISFMPYTHLWGNIFITPILTILYIYYKFLKICLGVKDKVFDVNKYRYENVLRELNKMKYICP